MRRMLWCAVGAWALSAQAQQLITDPAAFRSPAVFVTPDRPEGALAAAEEVTYRATVEVDATGRVATLLRLEPDEAEFRRQVEDAMRFWVFYPSIDPDTCMTRSGQARIELQYRRDRDQPRVWSHVDPMRSLFGARPAPRVLEKPRVVRYPKEEMLKGVEGDVFVIVVFGPDGTVGDARLLLAVPTAKGLVKAALDASRDMRVDASPEPMRCAIQSFAFKISR